MIEEMIKREIERTISDRIEDEIIERTKEFHSELIQRKDQYIAEVMKGIRIMHENNPQGMYVDYRILFVNKYEVKKHERSDS